MGLQWSEFSIKFELWWKRRWWNGSTWHVDMNTLHIEAETKWLLPYKRYFRIFLSWIKTVIYFDSNFTGIGSQIGSKSSLIQIVVLRIPANTLPEAIVWPMCMIFGVTRLQWVKQDEWFREMNMRFDPLSVSPCLSWCNGGVIEQFVVRLPVPSVDIIPVYSRDRCRLQHPPWIHQDVISQCPGDHSAMNLWAPLSWGENSSKCCQINGGCVIWQNYSRRTWPEVDACVTFGKCHQKFVITLHTVRKIVFIS